jgi:hypothetical protein
LRLQVGTEGYKRVTEKMKVHKVCKRGYNNGTVCSGRESLLTRTVADFSAYFIASAQRKSIRVMEAKSHFIVDAYESSAE